MIGHPPIPIGITLYDHYNFGSPRVGRADWADAFAKALSTHRGASWRIVNNADLIPQVPPTELKAFPPEFIHIDGGKRIFKDKEPEDIASERNVDPPPQPIKIPHTMKELWKLLKESGDHCKDVFFALANDY